MGKSNMDNYYANQTEFNIKDLANMVKKTTKTIRSWEDKGIIQRPPRKSDNKYEWRYYSQDEIIEALENVLNHHWERETIKNKEELKKIIQIMRNEKSKRFIRDFGNKPDN